MDARPESPGDAPALRFPHRKRWIRRALLVAGALAALAAAGVGYTWANRPAPATARPAAPATTMTSTSAEPTTTSTEATTTTTTIPDVVQPQWAELPAPGRLGIGSKGDTVLAYEQRLQQLHFDPGDVDGVFDQRTQYAVVSAQKFGGLGRTGVIDGGVQFVLSLFKYEPAEPKGAGNRVEIDLDRQTLTVYHDWQPVLLTTTSTGNGEYFCGGEDGCQYAITPAGSFKFWTRHKGWKEGKLGRMYNPVFFNGGIAVHGLESVPAYPASHGCARIPMYVADYFPSLVSNGGAVYVVGTPKEAGDRYVGPKPTIPPAPETTKRPPAEPETPPDTEPPVPDTTPTTGTNG